MQSKSQPIGAVTFTASDTHSTMSKKQLKEMVFNSYCPDDYRPIPLSIRNKYNRQHRKH